MVVLTVKISDKGTDDVLRVTFPPSALKDQGDLAAEISRIPTVPAGLNDTKKEPPMLQYRLRLYESELSKVRRLHNKKAKLAAAKIEAQAEALRLQVGRPLSRARDRTGSVDIAVHSDGQWTQNLSVSYSMSLSDCLFSSRSDVGDMNMLLWSNVLRRMPGCSA